MRKKESFKIKIEESDWDSFIEWTIKEKLFFNNPSFYTDILNSKTFNKLPNTFEDSFWEFYFYNKKYLDNKYDIFNDYDFIEDFEKEKFNFKKKNLIDFFEHLLIYWKKNKEIIKELFVFLDKVDKHLLNLNTNENIDIFYEFLNYTDILVVKRVDNFNRLIKHLNKYVIKELKKSFL